MYPKTLLLQLFITIPVIFARPGRNGQVSDECVMKDTEETFLCVLLKDCEEAKKQLKRNRPPQTCGFYRNEPIVCCPGVKRKKRSEPGDIATKVCDKLTADLSPVKTAFQKRSVDMRLNVPEIIGGEIAVRKEFKHMALIGFDDGGEKNWQCGGSLISEEYVLTAAHCLYTRELGQVKYVRLGELDYATKNDNSQFQDFTISKIIPHPKYRHPTAYNDIALLKLNKPAILDDFVRPVCLHTKKEIEPMQGSLVIAGWGKTEYLADKGSSHLRKAKVELFPWKSCSEVYPKTARNLEKGIIDELQICAGSRVDENNTCQGDSGGPLELDRKLRWGTLSTIVGITSFGKACGFKGIPGVYTRVSNYIGWIENIVWKGKD